STVVEGIGGFIGNYDVGVRSGDGERSLKAGVIIVATGAEELKPVGMYNYDGKNVVTQLELEQMLRDGSFKADRIIMIQCVGARNEERVYCSRVCCMTAIQNAMVIKETNPNTEVFILYRDMQTYGTRYENIYRKARELGILFIEFPEDRKITVDKGTVKVFDVFLDEELTLPYDLVVLSTPMTPQLGSKDLAKMLKVPLGENGFFLEAHVKLRPVDFSTDGIFLCGSAHWPSDLAESVSQAYAAASKASIPLSRGKVKTEPIVSSVDEEKCIGCGLCELTCPFKAISVKQTEKGRVAKTIIASCKGCGVCSAGCPEKAINMHHFTDRQLTAQIVSLAEVKTVGSD
ncbi:MAG: CoB--CoM heterodisulfide reductase iron-sulfur subunit A family protein, partial [Candidatus Bathyarchaeota archaeon]